MRLLCHTAAAAVLLSGFAASPALADQNYRAICLHNRVLDRLAVAAQVRMCTGNSYNCTDWTRLSINAKGNGWKGRGVFAWPIAQNQNAYLEIEAQSGKGLGLRATKPGATIWFPPTKENMDRVCNQYSWFICGTDENTGNSRFYLQNGAQLSFDATCLK